MALPLRRSTSKTKAVYRPREEWIPVEVPQIIDRATWDAARDRAKENQKASKRNVRHEYLMRSRLTCQHCGLGLYSRTHTDNGRPFRYYYCGGQDRRQSADNEHQSCQRSFRQEALDEIIREQIKHLLNHPDLLVEGIRKRQSSATVEVTALRDRLKAVHKNRDEIERQRSKLLDLYLSDDMLPKDLFAERMAEITRKREQAERECADLERRLREQTVGAQDEEAILAFCREVAEGLDSFTFEQKQRTIEKFDVRGVVVRSDDPAQDQVHLSGLIPALDMAVSSATVTTASQCDSPPARRPAATL